MELKHTRAMVSAALRGELDRATFTPHPVFRIEVPDRVPDVPPAVLDPRATWDDGEAYDAKARELATLFRQNFEKYGDVSRDVAKAGPRV